MRLNTKSPGRGTGAPGNSVNITGGMNSGNNFAPMTYGAAAAK